VFCTIIRRPVCHVPRYYTEVDQTEFVVLLFIKSRFQAYRKVNLMCHQIGSLPSPWLITSPRFLAPPPVTVSPSAQHEPSTLPSKHLGDEKVEATSMYAPPIVISNVTNYSSLKADLISLVGTDDFTATAKGSSLIIKPYNFDGYNKLVDYCNESDLECHMWAPVIFALSKCLSVICIILFLLKI
jgi:hypothetical protein